MCGCEKPLSLICSCFGDLLLFVVRVEDWCVLLLTSFLRIPHLHLFLHSAATDTYSFCRVHTHIDASKHVEDGQLLGSAWFLVLLCCGFDIHVVLPLLPLISALSLSVRVFLVPLHSSFAFPPLLLRSSPFLLSPAITYPLVLHAFALIRTPFPPSLPPSLPPLKY